MFSQLLEPEGLLTDAYRGVLAERPRGYSVTANDLFAEYELGWQVLRNVRLQELAEYYAERFYLLLCQLDVLDDILDRLDRIDSEYEKIIVSGELPEDAEAIALTAAMCLLVMLFRRLEARGEVKMLELSEVEAWLDQHARLLGDKHGQLILF
ncbi:MAG: hypothetical protein HY870_22430 [Chloroflexi bacterium]|nr:hypothetical protein [Chloroflexota bacterium]